MKKDIFNGKIKRAYRSYIVVTLVIVFAVFIGCGALFICAPIFDITADDFATKALLIFLGVLSLAFGIAYTILTIFAIRQYPKYPKLRQHLLNSDVYFVDSTSTDYRGDWKGRATFKEIVRAGELSEKLGEVEYPRRYKVYIALMVACLVLMFAILCVVILFAVNGDAYRWANEHYEEVIALAVCAWIILLMLAFIFAFGIRKARESAVRERFEQTNTTDKHRS